MRHSKLHWLAVFLLSFILNANAFAYQSKSLERAFYSDDSVLVFVSKKGYETDVIQPGRYVTVSNFSGKKVTGKLRIINRRTILVGHTVVPINHIKKISIKSSMYPVSTKIKKAGFFLLKKVPKWVFSSLKFDGSGGDFVLAIFAFVFMLAGILVGLLLLLIALPGLTVSKTYRTKDWKIYVKPKR